jgi:HK97 family phage major capsid protein
MVGKDQILRSRAAEIQRDLDAIKAAADAREGDEKGIFTAEELATFKGKTAALRSMKEQLEAYEEERSAQIRDYLNRRGAAAPGELAETGGASATFDDGARITSLENANGPFPALAKTTDRAERTRSLARGLGTQLQAIMASSKPGGRIDERLLHVGAGPSGASANVGADGAFLIQKDYAAELYKMAFETGVLASRCSSTDISEGSDGLEVVYIDETSRATGSRWGGVRVYRTAEAETATASKPKLGKWECRLEDMMGIAYMTERLMADAPAMGSVFQEAFRDEFAFVLDDEIVRGTGVGQCMGILNAGCLVTVSKETGQAADCVVAENIQKMFKSVPQDSRARGAWFYNQELDDSLQNMQIGTGASAQLVYMPPGGLSGNPYGTIYGRPVIPIEHASGAGDVGDIFFADLSMYKLIRKAGIQSDESIHVRFLYNERTFRWVTRVNGAPKLKSSITPYKATSATFKKSPFVTLAAR